MEKTNPETINISSIFSEFQKQHRETNQLSQNIVARLERVEQRLNDMNSDDEPESPVQRCKSPGVRSVHFRFGGGKY